MKRMRGGAAATVRGGWGGAPRRMRGGGAATVRGGWGGTPRRVLGFSLGLFTLSLVASVAPGCSEDKPEATGTSSPDAGAGDGGGSTTAPLAEPAVPCTDPDDAIYGDPGFSGAVADADRGAIVKCSKGQEISKDALQAELTRVGYSGKPATSGARSYKVVYKTQRGDPAKSGGYSSAIVYVPTVQRAEKLPVIVAGRGSRGQAAKCALSKLDPVIPDQNDDAYRLNYTLAGHGYAVIVPDLAGYANFGAPGNPASGYAQAADVARSTLDGSRALKKLYPQLDDKTALVGHSQGGHNVLAALAESATYGIQGTLTGVAVYAPLWLSQRSWGALLDAGVVIDRGYTLAGPYATASAVSVLYHYTQAELLDGPGEGVKLFKPEHQALVKTFVESACWGQWQPLQAAATYVYELFTTDFSNAVGPTASGYRSSCPTGNAVCEKWRARYSADRAHITGPAASIPILMLYGGKDTTIPPDRVTCGIDRLKTDGANLTVCYEAEATHPSIINVKGDYVADWVASVTLGAAAPAACAANESAIGVGCNTIPPND
jgi:alpha-beta hydrolase superfamily lysophospholipase